MRSPARVDRTRTRGDRGAAAWQALVLGLLLGACSTPPCTSLDPGERRDRCLHQLLLEQPPEALDKVSALAQQIEDPIYRTAAVQLWVIEHGQACPHEGVTQLCGLLTPKEQTWCLQRRDSVHLQR